MRQSLCHPYVQIFNKLNIMNNYRNDREQELVVVFTDLPWGMVTQSQSPKYSLLAETTNKYLYMCLTDKMHQNLLLC